MLPFSREVYYALFAQSNAQYWWAHLAAFGLVLWIIAGCWLHPKRWAPGLCAALSILWAGTAIVWYFLTLGDVYFMAPWYALVAFLQAGGFAAAALAVWRRSGSVRGEPREHGIFGLVLCGAGLMYFVFDWLVGPGWSAVRLPALHAEPLLLMSAGVLVSLHLGIWNILWTGLLILACATGFHAYVLDLHYDWLVAVLVLVGLLSKRRLRHRQGPEQTGPQDARAADASTGSSSA